MLNSGRIVPACSVNELPMNNAANLRQHDIQFYPKYFSPWERKPHRLTLERNMTPTSKPNSFGKFPFFRDSSHKPDASSTLVTKDYCIIVFNSSSESSKSGSSTTSSMDSLPVTSISIIRAVLISVTVDILLPAILRSLLLRTINFTLPIEIIGNRNSILPPAIDRIGFVFVYSIFPFFTRAMVSQRPPDHTRNAPE